MSDSHGNWLAHRALACPRRLALRADGVDLTYADLERESNRVARRLAARGVGEGSPVVVELGPGLHFAIALHALMKLGAVVHPLSPRLTGAERERELRRAEPALVISSPADLEGPEAETPPPRGRDLDALCCRLLTSGTSGEPAQVGLTYGNFLWSAVGSAFNLGVDPDDRWLCCLPLNHVAGLSILTRSVIYGTGAVVHPDFQVERVASSLAEDGITLVSLVATQLVRLLEAGVDLSGPRAILVGGGPVPAEALAEATARGAVVVQTYGMTQTCSQVATLAPADAERKAGSAGKPLFGAEVRISEGEILVRGPMVAPGWTDADGWLRTGDLGRIDDEGFLWVEGRADDVIVSGGENVIPDEVEAVLRRHPDVEDAAVVGRPDAVWQQAVTAVVVLREGASADAEALREWCAAELAGHKVPKRFEFAGELPRTGSGKLLRRALR